MKRCSIVTLLLLVLVSKNLHAQSNYLPLNPSYYHSIDRYEVLSGKLYSEFHTSVKPYTRKSVANFARNLSSDTIYNARDQFNFSYLQNDSWEWADSSTGNNKPVLKHFYKKKSDFFHVHTKDFDLHVNPSLYFAAGYEQGRGPVTINTRGAEVRGMIDQKVGFYSFFADNVLLLPDYVKAYRDVRFVVPGEGFNKPFKSNPNGADFITARGYFNFNATKNIALQFGHDKNFIGNGYRSLILSDFSNSYTFLKLNTNIWKINYMNLFAEMTATYSLGDKLFPKKYMAFHHLSINIGKNLNIGLFESVAFRGRSSDSTKWGKFDITYLNPIIFYRSVEQQLGSSDNALLGMDYKWNFLRHFSLYGQFVLDEFLLSHIKARDGWWANKQAAQVGLKYINLAGIKNLDAQVELNYIRPYVYMHGTPYTNFTHYNQPIAHPLGANLYEYIAILHAQPLKRLQATAKLFYIKQGLDAADSLNWGGDLFKNYAQYEQEFGNKTAQGTPSTTLMSSLSISYMVFHNFFVESTVIVRNQNVAEPLVSSNTLIGTFAMRWNIARRLQEF
ncbi:MAG: hypothetical protein NZ529_10120 [Cytophagaceae bacterium]|nr:hypothetical protein [Cytophagaceae bacterium]MDW8457140.1 hypothetical protein [Cytophagaceae bacterium]